MLGCEPLFTSARERRLWFWALAVVVAIYSTLELTGRLAAALAEYREQYSAFLFLLFILIVAIVGSGLKKRPGRIEIWVALGVTAVYGIALLRMGWAERTHLFEYGLVGVLIYQALSERSANGGKVRAPAVLAISVTVLIGWLDEGIQSFLPNRVYDLVDVGFNALAGFMSIAASVVVTRARRWISARRS